MEINFGCIQQLMKREMMVVLYLLQLKIINVFVDYKTSDDYLK